MRLPEEKEPGSILSFFGTPLWFLVRFVFQPCDGAMKSASICVICGLLRSAMLSQAWSCSAEELSLVTRLSLLVRAGNGIALREYLTFPDVGPTSNEQRATSNQGKSGT